MTSETLPEDKKKACAKIKSCICEAINKTKETYFECDFNINEKVHSGDSENPEIKMVKHGKIKIRIFDIIVTCTVMSMVMTISRIFRK